MKIEYKDADGRVLELEVSDEVGQFCIFSAEEEAKSDRRNSRPDRHTSLEAFTYENQRFFASPSDTMQEAVEDSEVERLLSCLDGRQRELVRKCVIEGWIYAEIGPMSILWTKKVERLCCFFKFLILLLLWCQITNRAMYPLTVIPAFYVFKDCSAGFL